MTPEAAPRCDFRCAMSLDHEGPHTVQRETEAAQPATPGGALDVERLRTALIAVFWSGNLPMFGTKDDNPTDYADAIAAEYARLRGDGRG